MVMFSFAFAVVVDKMFLSEDFFVFDVTLVDLELVGLAFFMSPYKFSVQVAVVQFDV